MTQTLPEGRISQLRARLDTEGVDALLVSASSNIRYLTGFTGSNGRVVVTKSAVTLITDARYEARAVDESAVVRDDVGVDIDVAIAPGAGESELLRRLVEAGEIGLEADHLSWSTAQRLSDLLSADRVRPTTGIVESLRERKSESEIGLMRRAAAIADEALALVISSGIEGMSERAVQRVLDQRALELGADGASFDTIVASGPNGARPHHEAGDRVLAAGDLVIIDFGAEVAGYRSDMTRSFVLGEPTTQQRQMLDAVEVSQRAGVDADRAGLATSEIDSTCRSALAEYDLADYFVHGTGHGVGLDIHEAPSVSSTSTATLAPGHVITVEPGVYIPNVGGVRWEDTVLVTAAGAEALTGSPKQPIIEL